MRYFRFRFSGEVAFRTNEPPPEITLDVIKKLLDDKKNAIGEWHFDDPEEIDDLEMAITVRDLKGDPHDYVQGRLPGFF